MIGLCSAQKMAVFVSAMILISILSIVVENYYASDSNKEKQSYTEQPNMSTGGCWDTETYTILEKCVPCTEFEKKVGHKRYCVPSGLFDRVNCSVSGIDYRSCLTNEPHEERKFWSFYIVSFIGAVMSTGFVIVRQRTLDRIAFAKVQQRLGDGI